MLHAMRHGLQLCLDSPVAHTTCASALELDMSDDDITSFMAGLGYDVQSGASISLDSFQAGMRQIMRFTMSDKSVTAALAALCKDRYIREILMFVSLH